MPRLSSPCSAADLVDDHTAQPVSTDTERGAELVKAEQSASAQVLVGHHRRFNPYITKSKELLADQSRFGKSASALLTSNLPLYRLSPGCRIHSACHSRRLGNTQAAQLLRAANGVA